MVAQAGHLHGYPVGSKLSGRLKAVWQDFWGHREKAFELVCGAVFSCILMFRASPDDLGGHGVDLRPPGVLLKGPRGPFRGPRGPLKGPRGPFKGPRGPFEGPRGLLKGPRDPLTTAASGGKNIKVASFRAWEHHGRRGNASFPCFGAPRSAGGNRKIVQEVVWALAKPRPGGPPEQLLRVAAERLFGKRWAFEKLCGGGFA